MEYKVSLSFEYTNFCLIMYLKILTTTCTYSFKILIKSTTFQHILVVATTIIKEGPPPQANTPLLQTVYLIIHTQSDLLASSINTEHDEHRCTAPIKPLRTIEIQDVKVGTCTICGSVATIQLYLQLYNTQSQD